MHVTGVLKVQKEKYFQKSEMSSPKQINRGYFNILFI